MGNAFWNLFSPLSILLGPATICVHWNDIPLWVPAFALVLLGGSESPRLTAVASGGPSERWTHPKQAAGAREEGADTLSLSLSSSAVSVSVFSVFDWQQLKTKHNLSGSFWTDCVWATLTDTIESYLSLFVFLTLSYLQNNVLCSELMYVELKDKY